MCDTRTMQNIMRVFLVKNSVSSMNYLYSRLTVEYIKPTRDTFGRGALTRIDGRLNYV